MENETSNTPALLARSEPISVTVSVAGDYCGLPRSTICELIADGTLETALIGRRRLIIYESLKLYILSQKTDGISRAAKARAQRIRAGVPQPKRRKAAA